MAVNDIGRVVPIWRGIFNPETAYELNDIVLDAEGSVWWHVSEEITTGTSPGSGEVWAAVIDMGVFSATIRAAIEEAQAAVRAAQEAAGTLEGFAERAEAAANEATLSAGAASDFATAASDEKREAEAARAGAETAQSAAETAQAAAETAQMAAETAKTGAETARSGAQTAKTGAEAARDTAQTYKQSAAASKDAAELARDKAEEYAGALEVQIDPTFKTPGTAAESVAVSKKTASAVIGTASGNPAVLPDAAGERVMRSVVVNIEPAQAGAGDPSPENVRAISGFTGARVVRCGRNLAELHNDTNQDAWKFTYSLQDGGNIVCVKNAPENRFFAKYLFPAVKGTAYRFKFDSLTVNGAAASTHIYLYRDALWGELIVPSAIPFPGEAAWTATESGLIVLGLYSPRTWEEGAQIAMDGFRVGLASEEDKGYEASVWDTADIAFPSEAGTVGAGTLDLTTGVLTVTHLFRQFDGTEPWELSTSGTYPFFYTPTGVAVENSSNGWCSHFKWTRIRGSNQDIGMDAVNGAAGRVFSLRPGDSIAQTVEELTAWLADQATAGTPLQCVFKLGSPLTYTLTPRQIAVLAGFNAVWADCGPVSVEYVRDTGMVIEAGDASTRAMIGEASGTTASRSLAVGEYVTVGDKLYRVTAAVGSGETLVPGTNVTETTVGAELARLAAMINA